MDRIPILDHGYVELIESWGSDERIIESARMSTDKGFLGWEPEVEYECSECEYICVSHYPVNEHITCPANSSHGTLTYRLLHHGDEKLLAYLWNNKHTTPFEMAGFTIEVQAPIAVFREWHRHRTQSYSEMSGRYVTLPDLFYVPSIERMMAAKQGTGNKQGSQEGFTASMADRFRAKLELEYIHTRAAYEELLREGVAREVARLVSPVAQYSRMRSSTDLWNWLHFLRLRMAPGAQWEIRQYANVVGEIVKQLYPRTWELFHATL